MSLVTSLPSLHQLLSEVGSEGLRPTLYLVYTSYLLRGGVRGYGMLPVLSHLAPRGVWSTGCRGKVVQALQAPSLPRETTYQGGYASCTG